MSPNVHCFLHVETLACENNSEASPESMNSLELQQGQLQMQSY